MLQRRIIAYVIDLVLAVLLGILVVRITHFEIPNHTMYPALTKYFFMTGVVMFLNEFISLSLNRQSLGHQLMGLSVQFRQPLTSMIFIRSMLKVISTVTIFVGVLSFIIMIKNEEGKSMHDSIAGSQVYVNHSIH